MKDKPLLTIKDVRIHADGLDHPECIAWHPDGSLWAGGEAGQVYRIAPDGTIDELANTGGFVLGIAFSPDLSWLAVCDLKKKCVWRLDLGDHSLSVFTRGVSSHSLNIPNFVCFDGKGALYLSESGGFRQVAGKILKFKENGEGGVWSGIRTPS